MLHVPLRHRDAVRATLAAVDARVEEDEDVGEVWLEGELRGYRALKETDAVNPDDVAWKAAAEKWADDWDAPESWRDEWIDAYLQGVKFVADRVAQEAGGRQEPDERGVEAMCRAFQEVREESEFWSFFY